MTQATKFEEVKEKPALAYEPFGALKDGLYCKDNEVLIEGPVRTGKTRMILEKCHILASKYPGIRILWVRKTKESLSESALQTFEDHVLPDNHYLKAGPQRRFRNKYTYRNGSQIIIGGMDKSSKILSTEYDIIVAFEATELTQEDWETLVTRCNNGVMPYNQCISDCNPGPPKHWLNQRANEGVMTRIQSRLEDNPKFYDHDKEQWTEHGHTLIEKLDKLTGPRKLRLRLGLWAAAEGLVYENFDPAVHVIDRFDIPKDWLRFRVIDFGYVNPFVCQWWAVDEDGRAYMYREIYHTKRLVQDHAKQINALTGGETIDFTVADHDAEDRATLHKEGIFTVPAIKDITTGLESVTNRLSVNGDGRPRLFILRDSLVEKDPELFEAHKPTCTEHEFDSYIYPPQKEGREVKEQPIKVDDHGMDCVRYGMRWLDKYYGITPVSYVDTTADTVEHGEDVMTSDDFCISEDEAFDNIMEDEAAWV
jgi:phage terminase large subunit